MIFKDITEIDKDSILKELEKKIKKYKINSAFRLDTKISVPVNIVVLHKIKHYFLKDDEIKFIFEIYKEDFENHKNLINEMIDLFNKYNISYYDNYSELEKIASNYKDY